MLTQAHAHAHTHPRPRPHPHPHPRAGTHDLYIKHDPLKLQEASDALFVFALIFSVATTAATSEGRAHMEAFLRALVSCKLEEYVSPAGERPVGGLGASVRGLGACMCIGLHGRSGWVVLAQWLGCKGAACVVRVRASRLSRSMGREEDVPPAGWRLARKGVGLVVQGRRLCHDTLHDCLMQGAQLCAASASTPSCLVLVHQASTGSETEEFLCFEFRPPSQTLSTVPQATATTTQMSPSWRSQLRPSPLPWPVC